MKAFSLIKSIAGALMILGTISAYAQTSGTDAAAQPATGQSTKAARKTDHALARKVRGALAKSKGISVANVVVRARGGAVILEGTVPEEELIDQAVQIAQGVQGVTSVQSALSIHPVGQ